MRFEKTIHLMHVLPTSELHCDFIWDHLPLKVCSKAIIFIQARLVLNDYRFQVLTADLQILLLPSKFNLSYKHPAVYFTRPAHIHIRYIPQLSNLFFCYQRCFSAIPIEFCNKTTTKQKLLHRIYSMRDEIVIIDTTLSEWFHYRSVFSMYVVCNKCLNDWGFH